MKKYLLAVLLLIPAMAFCQDGTIFIRINKIQKPYSGDMCEKMPDFRITATVDGRDTIIERAWVLSSTKKFKFEDFQKFVNTNIAYGFTFKGTETIWMVRSSTKRRWLLISIVYPYTKMH